MSSRVSKIDRSLVDSLTASIFWMLNYENTSYPWRTQTIGKHWRPRVWRVSWRIDHAQATCSFSFNQKKFSLIPWSLWLYLMAFVGNDQEAADRKMAGLPGLTKWRNNGPKEQEFMLHCRENNYFHNCAPYELWTLLKAGNDQWNLCFFQICLSVEWRLHFLRLNSSVWSVAVVEHLVELWQ